MIFTKYWEAINEGDLFDILRKNNQFVIVLFYYVLLKLIEISGCNDFLF